MLARKVFEFLNAIPAYPVTHNNEKVGVLGKSFIAKAKNKVFAVIFVFIIFLMILHFCKHPSMSRIQKTRKTKRHLTMEQFNEYQEDMGMPKNDIQIVPENRRFNQHPNHRYVKDKIYEGAVNETNGRFPQGLNIHEYPINVQDVILRGKTRDGHVRGQNKFLNQMMKGLGTSMRLKGVYKQSGVPDSEFAESYTNSKEINNLMHNNSAKGGKRLRLSSLRLRGVPFRVPYKDLQKPNFRFNVKRHPITIFLDFFPMHLEELRIKKFNGSMGKHSDFSTQESVNLQKYLPIGRRKNGMIMKLNLYPKEPTRRDLMQKLHHPLHVNQHAQRKSFGWFSKHKKKKPCPYVGLNPDEQHITAKWRDENGEWVHADRVVLKYLKEEQDSSKT